MIVLQRHTAQHRGNPPLLCFASPSTVVFVERNALMHGGHRQGGVLINEPVAFADIAAASAVAATIRGQCVIVEYDEGRNGQGKLVSLTRKAGSTDVEPAPRP
jgi:hypothetical protein